MFCLVVGSHVGAQVAIGTRVDAPFTDLRWQDRRIADLGPHAAIVIYFATVECPMVRRYIPRLGEIAQAYSGRDVVTVVANVGAGDGFVDAAAQVAEFAPAAIFAKDSDLQLARACGVDRTGAVVVLDRDRTLRYRGRIDDQHGFATNRAEVARSDLRKSLDEVLAGQAVTIPETAITGCRLTPPPSVDAGHVPTYLRDVVPILASHCATCHSGDAAAPFSLTNEVDVRKHAMMIAEVVGNGRMPPWPAASTSEGFVNRRGLTLVERETIRLWVAGGMPRGEAVDSGFRNHPMMPEWSNGRPDLILDAKESLAVPATGSLPYQYFELPHVFDRETWVESVEVRSKAGRTLHHCNVACLPSGAPFAARAIVCNAVPHGRHLACEAGTAVRIPAGSVLMLQAYYVPSGQPELDRLCVGLRFPRVPVQRERRVAIATNEDFEIPAGASSHPVSASLTLPEDAVGLSLFAHMNVRGRDVTVVAATPEGARRTLLVVPNYDFASQETFVWQQGVRLFTRGTRIEALAHFDNSAWNAANPDPKRIVRAGAANAEESLMVFLAWVEEDQMLGLRIDPATGMCVGSLGDFHPGK